MKVHFSHKKLLLNEVRGRRRTLLLYLLPFNMLISPLMLRGLKMPFLHIGFTGDIQMGHLPVLVNFAVDSRFIPINHHL